MSAKLSGYFGWCLAWFDYLLGFGNWFGLCFDFGVCVFLIAAASGWDDLAW